MQDCHWTEGRNRAGKAGAELPAGPFFEREGFALYQGSSTQWLPTLPTGIAAAVITDPPYSSGGRSTAEKAADPVEKYCQNGNACGRPTFSGDNRDQRSFFRWASMWLEECYRIVRPGGYCLVFTDWRQLPLMSDALQAGGFVWRGVIAWNKGRGARAPHKGYFRHQCEYLVWGSRGELPIATHGGPYDGCVTEVVRRADKHHITGKPTPLMRQLVECVPPGELVVDPFAGSCTTLVACAETGRRALGCELSADYCRIGARRLDSVISRA